MNRKQMACATAGALLGAGCSPAKSLPMQFDDARAAAPGASFNKDAARLTEVRLSLLSGPTGRDFGSVLFYLAPKSGWSIKSSDPRLHVDIKNGHVATIEAPPHKAINFQSLVTISHTDGTEYEVRCHVETDC